MARPASTNPWIGLTFIPDNTRMAVPPAYFLQRLHDYDTDLVVLPSRMVPFAYVIARRARLSKGLTDKAIEETIDQKDTKMCMKYGLVPVCLMYRTGFSWDPDQIVRKLAARDMWAIEGTTSEIRGNRAADMLEAREAAEKEKIRQQIRDDLHQRSVDAWASYQYRTGNRISTANLGRPRTGRRQSGTVPTSSSRTATAGAMFTNR